jgi:aminomethyltransferase
LRFLVAVAVQGPAAKDVLQGLTKSDLSALYFSMFDSIDIGGVPVWITRTGYTGEDGFEISIPVDRTLELAEQICASDRVRLCGLGARDSLRLEAGLCLYGETLRNPNRACLLDPGG